jgi:hypothetical protein
MEAAMHTASRRMRRLLSTVSVLSALGIVLVVTVPTLAAGAAATALTKPIKNGSSCGKADAYSEAVLASDPMVYYRLNESEGPTACDSSGNGNNGTYASSGVSYGVKGPLKCCTNTAISANGTVDPVTGPSSGSGVPATDTSFTLEGWWKSTSTNDQMLVDVGQAGYLQAVGLGVWPVGGKEPVSKTVLAIDLYETNVTFNLPKGDNVLNGKWHLLDVTYNATTEKFHGYIDGKSVGIKSAPGEVDLDGGLVRVGWWVDTIDDQLFNGSIDEVAIYPKVLKESVIAHHYGVATS